MWKNSSRLTWTEKTDYRTWQYLNLLSCLLLPFKSGCAWKSPWCQNTGPLQWCVFIVFRIAHPAFRTDRRFIGLLRFEGISLSHLVQPPCLRVVSESWLSRSVCRWFFYLQGYYLCNKSGQSWPKSGCPHRHIGEKRAKQQVLICITEVHTPKNTFWISGIWTGS